MKKVRPEKDTYGQEVLAYYKKEESFEVVERDDGYLDIARSGPKSYFADYGDWPDAEKAAVKLAKGTVLDIGCGAGRCCLYLQKKGLKVIGIDNSPLAVKVCKLRGVKDVRLMPIEDIGKFKKDFFDTVLMMGNNFGLFCNFQKAKLLLKKLYRITSSGAVIIAASNDPTKTTEKAHIEYQKLNKKRGKMPGQLRIRVRFKEYIGEWFEYLIVSEAELKKILSGTGWKIKKIMHSNSRSSYYIAVIGKI